jgi:hypothetical protein
MRHPALSPPTSPRSSSRVALALGASLALVFSTQAAAGAQEAPYERGIDDACRAGAQEANHFDDVEPGDPHASAIHCLWAYAIVQGNVHDGGFVYQPHDNVTRQQMASFTGSQLRALPDRYYQVPDVDEPDFADADRISAAHQRNVAVLQEAGIVSGYADGTYRPHLSIDRAQMATFIARAIEGVTGAELPRADVFDDVSGPHASNIEKLAAIGVVQGVDEGTYGPDRSTTRAQMASFVAGSLDYLAGQGLLIPLAFAEHDETARLVITDAEVGEHDDHDRATFTMAGDDAQPGWQIRYTDEPVAHGSGQPVDVAGDAVLEVVFTGMAPPPGLDDEDDAWDGETITVDGDGIVEVENVGWYEGRHQLFIGTTDLNWFSVEQLDDPQRVYLDVSHR